MSRPTAARGTYPYRNHRTMAEVMADEMRYGDEAESYRQTKDIRKASAMLAKAIWAARAAA